MSSFRLLTGTVFLLWIAGLTGCASGHTSGQLLSMSQPSGSSFFVARQEKDGRNLAENIAANLRQRGYAASHGEADTRPPEVTYVVNYIDHWAWDMRMYLSDLRIEVRDPATGAIIAYGQSVQNSLKAMGWGHDKVIDLAVTEIMGQPLMQED